MKRIQKTIFVGLVLSAGAYADRSFVTDRKPDAEVIEQLDVKGVVRRVETSASDDVSALKETFNAALNKKTAVVLFCPQDTAGFFQGLETAWDLTRRDNKDYIAVVPECSSDETVLLSQLAVAYGARGVFQTLENASTKRLNRFLKKAGDQLIGWQSNFVVSYTDGNLSNPGMCPAAYPEGAGFDLVIGTYNRGPQCRLFIMNTADETSAFSLKTIEGFEPGAVLASTGAQKTGDLWSLKKGGAVLVEYNPVPDGDRYLRNTDLGGKIPLGLYVENGVLKKDGRRYVGMGMNYFDAFYRVLLNPANRSYKEGFEVLKKYDVEFIRFNCGGFWPSEWKIYQQDKDRYFELLDELVDEAEKAGIGLIPSLFWDWSCVPDMVGEPVNRMGDPNSRTVAFYRQYIREVVSRYKDRAVIWGWEMGNEYELQADLPYTFPKARAHVSVERGTPSEDERTQRDALNHLAVRNAYRFFANEVHRLDPYRVIDTGAAMTRSQSYHFHVLNDRSWKSPDTRDQFQEMLRANNPGYIDLVSVHNYSHQDGSFFTEGVPVEDLLRTVFETAKQSGKVMFLGEFGESLKKGDEPSRAYFYRIMNIVEDVGIQLSAPWVFDFSPQDGDWNVTETNSRRYVLEAVRDFNRKHGTHCLRRGNE